MNTLTHLFQQFIAWLTVVWMWCVGGVTPLWQTIPYHRAIAATFVTWYAQGFVWLALAVIIVLVVIRWVWLRLYGFVQHTHYDKAAQWYLAITALIRHERALTQRGMAPIHQARRHMKDYFYTYQLVLIADVTVRHDIRELVHLVDEDAAGFEKKVVLKNIYQLHSFAAQQLHNYPRSIRVLYWMMAGIWQRLPY
jgi:signal transduction histidine kinase